MTEKRTCDQCGNSFEPKARHQRFDHEQCRYQHCIEKSVQQANQRVEEGARRQSRDGKGTKVYLQPEELVYLWGQARASSLVWINGRRLDLPGLRSKLSRAADRTAGIGR